MFAPLTRLTYDRHTGFARRIEAGVDAIDFVTDYLGRHTEQKLRLPESTERTVSTTVSAAGRQFDQTGADGILRTYSYDNLGRLSEASDKHVSVTLEYDAVSRLCTRNAQANGASMIERDAYDGRGRLCCRSWEHTTSAGTRYVSLTMAWRSDGKLISRLYRDHEGACIREEALAYDARGRLADHQIVRAHDGAWPRDDAGREYLRQMFHFDAIDNLTQVETTFVDGGTNVTTLHYDTTDCDRLVRVTETAGPGLSMAYDANGAVAKLYDRDGEHTLTYDGAGRLSVIEHADGSSTRYRHGPGNRVTGVTHDGYLTNRVFEDGRLACALTPFAETRRYVRVGGELVAEALLASTVRTCLVGGDLQGSVVVEGDSIRTYGAYGTQNPAANDATAAFCDAVPEPGSGWYLLGQRLYVPALRRFISPDAFSPFADGGPNRYAYCGGDPIGRVDPNGQSWWEIGLTLFGIVAATAAMIASGGAALAAIGAATSVASAVSTPSIAALSVVAAIDAVSLVAEAGSALATLTEEETLSSIFGASALVTGIAGAATGLGSLATGATAIYRRTRASSRLFGTAATGRSAASASDGSTRVLSGFRPLIAYEGADVPTKRLVTHAGGKTEVKPVWHKAKTRRATYWAADTEVTVRDVSTRLFQIARKLPVNTGARRNVFLYGGVHGFPDAEPLWRNDRIRMGAEAWIEKAYGAHIDRNRSMFDIKGYNLYYVPLDKIDRPFYTATLNMSGIHVLGTCYGVADETFLGVSKMFPWPIYVPPT